MKTDDTISGSYDPLNRLRQIYRVTNAQAVAPATGIRIQREFRRPLSSPEERPERAGACDGAGRGPDGAGADRCTDGARSGARGVSIRGVGAGAGAEYDGVLGALLKLGLEDR